MSDIPKLCKWLRRFECRDRDGNYWSPQEILEAADVLERQEAENAKLLAENAEMQRDAERFRYIREHMTCANSLHMDGSCHYRLRSPRARARSLDDAIDLDMKGGEA